MTAALDRLTGPVLQWWDGRTRREQRMLAVMLVLLAAVIVWLGVVRPVFAWRADAADDRRRAAVELAEVRADLARLRPAEGPAPTLDAQGLEPVLRQTAEAAGLEVAFAMDAGGRLGFRAPNAPAGALFGWLAALKTTHNLDPVALSVIENTDATVNAEGAFGR